MRLSNFVLFIVASISFTAYGVTQITSVEFKGEPGGGQVEVLADGPLIYDKQINEADKQVILEFKDAKIMKGQDRKLDTSSFDSPVLLISPYNVSGQENVARVVLQMRTSEAIDVNQNGNALHVKVGKSISGSTEVAKLKPSETVDTLNTNEKQSESADLSDAPAPKEQTKDTIDQFLSAQKNSIFSGKLIDLNVKDADITDVFKLIADASGFNIVLGQEVTGKITLSLVQVPWDQALDLIIRTRGLGAERRFNVLRVTSLTTLTAEKQQEQTARAAMEASAPKLTRQFQLSYAALDSVSKILADFGRARGSTSGAIASDSRTNSLIIQDTADNIERMKKLIDILDTQTPQVHIEGKVIEARETFSNVISGGLGVGNKANSTNTKNGSAYASFNAVDPATELTSATASTIGSSGTGSFAFSPKFGFFNGTNVLNAFLKIGETEASARVVSSPKLVVLSREAATITAGTSVPVTTTTNTSTGIVTSTTFLSANLSLNVTPTVNSDGGVLMQLQISRDVPGASGGVDPRSINTKVLVESGSTLVIGGMYSDTQRKSSSGFPFLRKLPLIGWFFGTQEESTDKDELFIFITPRILNAKEAGLAPT